MQWDEEKQNINEVRNLSPECFPPLPSLKQYNSLQILDKWKLDEGGDRLGDIEGKSLVVKDQGPKSKDH